MKIENLILIATSEHYKVETSFFVNLNEMGLIEILYIQNTRYVHQDKIKDIERMIRMHHELELNPEGIEVAFNLLQKIDFLQKELISAKNRLRLYEN